jgi:hypothetical protein
MKPHFIKHAIAVLNNDIGSYPMNTFLTAGDLNNDGRPDLVISGWNGKMVWLENRGNLPWREHLVDGAVKDVECGGSLVALTNSGFCDIICGSASGGQVWWWQNPGATNNPWHKHTILAPGTGFFHDTAIADATNEGRQSLLVTHQNPPSGADIYCLPIPTDPTVSPWPGLQVIAAGVSEALVAPDGQVLRHQAEEGLAVGDIDGDGLNEVVAGNHWYKYTGSVWQSHHFAKGYITNKVAIADLDGDGKNEIILAEGDPMIYGKVQGGRLGWFKPGADITALWHEHTLDDGLLDAHTLQVADLNGNGLPDILTGEIGWADAQRGYRRRAPWILLYENLVGGQFVRHILDQGTGIHEGILADLRGNGQLDIVSKPLHGPDRWNILVFENHSQS